MIDESKEQLFWLVIVIILVFFAGAVLIFSKDSPQNQQAGFSNSKTSSRLYTVYYTSGVFSPTNLQINIGDTVRFLNDSLLPVRIVSDPAEGGDLPLFDSVSQIPPQSSFSFTFTKRGIFDYRNPKRTEQKGTIIVK